MTPQRLSLHTFLFIHPQEIDLQITKFVLEVFGHASGLWCKFRKSYFSLIHCDDGDSSNWQHSLSNFRLQVLYLGLPL